MKYEIEAAVDFLTSLLFPTNSNKISHSQSTPTLQSTSPHNSTLSSSTSTTSLTSFSEETSNATSENENEKMSKLFRKTLSKTLIKKFASHWYEDEPIKGQAYRSILVDCENNFIDKVILESARKMNWKNFENVLKNNCKIGFQMWIDPGEVEVEFLSSSSPSPSSSSSSSPYKSSSKISNQIIYTIRKNTSASQRISRPVSPPSSSSSPSLPSSSPPSSPAPSSYSPFSPSSVDLKMPFFIRQNKPIRISVRQNEKLEEIVVKDLNNTFNHSISEFDNNNDDDDNDINNNNSTVKSTFAIPQPAM